MLGLPQRCLHKQVPTLLHACTPLGTRQAAQDEADGSHDVCVLCGSGGNLLCCDACPATYHVRCVGESNRAMGASEWLCPECRVGGRGERGGG